MVVLTEVLQGSSSSSSNHDCRYEYDVFLSFRGVDTRKNFVAHLLKALDAANLTTFYDDKDIESGQSLKPKLEDAIKASRASIIVLSKNYASSSWCLNELVLILDQHRKSDQQIVIPIFYHVEPTLVRKQQGSFGEAMAEHKQKMEAETNKEKRNQWTQNIELWTKALMDVANLKGKDAKDCVEPEFIEEIVTEIYRRLGLPIRSSLPHLIGMEFSILFITSWLTNGSSHPADILTITGMGGIGKTTLAKYVYGLHHHEFPASHMIEDIGRTCTHKFNGLLDLQKQLCDGIYNTSSIQVHDKQAYTSMIEKAIARKKVFIVLDDIDNVDQLHSLLGKQGFYPGSKIIITTKDASLAKKYAPNPRVQPKHTERSLYDLGEVASLELLSHHAFKCNDPKEGYEAVSKELVKYCGGHPLALEVLGNSLQEKEVTKWKECIRRLKKENDTRIKNVLQVSFDSLPSEEEKELFKHIACFFVGMDRDCAETILEACDFQSKLGINNLIDRCLLINKWNNTLTMHQLLQDMGRDMVRRESPNKPWERSRLWCPEEIVKVLKQKKVMDNILGLTFDTRMVEKEDKLCGSFEIETDALSKMDILMLLQLNYVHLKGSYKNFPQELRWLCMHGFPLKTIPFDLTIIKNLVALDMSYSKIQSLDMSSYSNPQPSRKRQKHLSGLSFKDKQLQLGSLKILILSFCEQLHSIGGFNKLPALERLIARNCIGLTHVCKSIEQCVELLYVDLSYCNKLKFPRNLGKLKKVEKLLVDGCDLNEPMQFDMDSPEMLKGICTHTNASSVIVESIPSALKCSATSLPSWLASLSLANNNLSNNSFPTDFSCLSMLQKLCLDDNPIDSMPNCVRSLPSLVVLSMNECKMLTSIEYPPCTLRLMRFYCPSKGNRLLLQKIVFHPEMSSLRILLNPVFLSESAGIEGMVKIEPMASVEEKVLRSLRWGNIERLKKLAVRYQIQMYYEYGIFSIAYEGRVMPKWIRYRTKWDANRPKRPSISFTMPSSPNSNKFRGLNICCCRHPTRLHKFDDSILPHIRLCNKTKKCSWMYTHCANTKAKRLAGGAECLTFLSHWMFGKNEMEAGDHIDVEMFSSMIPCEEIWELGFSLVYTDGEEEDTLNCTCNDNDDDSDYEREMEEEQEGKEDALSYDDDLMMMMMMIEEEEEEGKGKEVVLSCYNDDDQKMKMKIEEEEEEGKEDALSCYDDDDDDEKMMMKIEEEEEGTEDALNYYKSWNHIIGGDLSHFLYKTTTGEEEYTLVIWRFFFPFEEIFKAMYLSNEQVPEVLSEKDMGWFKAFS